MDRRAFLLGTGALGLAACAAPERDLLAPYEDVDIELRPGVTTSGGTIGAVPDPTSTVGDLSPMEALRASIEPPEDRIGASFVARARGAELVVEATPGDGVAAWTFTNPVASGDDLVFLVDDYDGTHYRVLLPIRPNGSFGWIRTDQVDLLRHNFAIRVDLDDFRLVVLDHDQVVMDTTVGVARDNAPTPRGRYYTTEIIQPPDPASAYGAYAYGLSGFSDTFVTFSGGPGQLGIHGTNDPDSIGTNVSSGCIRLRNDDITRMVEELKVPTGVPVEVL